MGDDDESIIDALDEATDDPPSEQRAVEMEGTVMPPLQYQLDETGAGNNFVRNTFATVSHETGEAEVSLASGGGVLVDFHGGERVFFPVKNIVAAAAQAVIDSEWGPSPED